MPPQNDPRKGGNDDAQINEIWARLGGEGEKAHETLKKNEANPGNARLPGGIEGGIAKLNMVKLGIYKEGDYKGQPFFMATGTVLLPVEHNGIPVRNMKTQMGPIPICPTKSSPKRKGKTFSEQYNVMLDALKLLTSLEDVAKLKWRDIPLFLKAIDKKAKEKPGIFFRFRTWTGKASAEYPNPRIVEEWNGRVDYNPEPIPATESAEYDPSFEQQSQAKPNSPGASPTTVSPPPSPKAATGKPGVKKTPPTPEVSNEEAYVKDLVSRVNNGDGNAEESLLKEAEKSGITEEEIPLYDSWDELGQAILSGKGTPEEVKNRAESTEGGSEGESTSEDQLPTDSGSEPDGNNGGSEEGEGARAGTDGKDVEGAREGEAEVAEEAEQGEEESEEDTEEDDGMPKKGNTCKYLPNQVKGKPTPKPVECEILEVDVAKKTCTLKDLTSGKKFGNVPFERMAPVD